MATDSEVSTTELKTGSGFSTQTLEFPQVIDVLRSFLSGPIAVPLLDSLVPHLQIGIIRRDLARAGEAGEYLRESQRPSFASLKDPRPVFEKLMVEIGRASCRERV